MIKRKRVIASVGSLAALAGAVFLAPAQGATGDDIYQCTFEGTTTQLTTITSIANVALGQPNTPGGTYRFDGTDLGTAQGAASPTCVYVDGDNDSGNPVPQVVDTTIVSTGTFTNTICGTGHATGDAFNAGAGTGTTLTTPRGVAKPLYEIEFVGGVGTLLVTGGTDGLGQGLTGGGVVDLVPPDGAPSQCTVDDLTGFHVRGSFAAVAD